MLRTSNLHHKIGSLLLGLSLLGCGGGVSSTSVTPPPPPPAKAMLDEVATSGQLGSGASMIRDSLESLKASDAAKAEALLKELDELETMSDAAKIKAKAKAMADKL